VDRPIIVVSQNSGLAIKERIYIKNTSPSEKKRLLWSRGICDKGDIRIAKPNINTGIGM
jgi:hypothetical protein